METKFKDVAHFFLGCNIKTDNGIETLDLAALQELHNFQLWDKVKPVLKTLDDIDDELFKEKYEKFEEMEKYATDGKSTVRCLALMFQQLIKDGYDVFSICEEGCLNGSA